jgi:hypothetical protein
LIYKVFSGFSIAAVKTGALPGEGFRGGQNVENPFVAYFLINTKPT